MADYDVFNGDADGICSLIQLRLAQPRNAQLITGVKRDIKLLSRIQAQAGDRITVLDVSMEKNQPGLLAALNAGASVFYADHHQSGDIPQHPKLEAHINTAANTCTALIVDYHLKGQYREWAIAAAYGDNITQVADDYARQLNLSEQQRQRLQDLGVAMNYNGYGTALNDLFYHPAELYRIAVNYPSPFDFIHEQAGVYRTMIEGYQSDLNRGLSCPPMQSNQHVAMLLLPNEPWARRISGVLGNELANQHPERAHIILTLREDATETDPVYVASLRAPKNNLSHADQLAMQFGGGGRKGAAGIDALPHTQLDHIWQLAEAAWK